LRFSGERLGRVVAAREWDPLTVPPPEADDGPELILEFLRSPTPIGTWRMTSALALVGRASNCGLVLPDPSVWSFHCCLLRTGLGTWVIDLLGHGGISLGGRRVRWGRLDDGDHLLIGKYLIRVCYDKRSTPRPEASPSAEVLDPGKPGVNGSRIDPGVPQPAALELPAAADLRPEAMGSVQATSPLRGGALVTVAPPRTELTEGILTSLFNQFATMQNQMFDQFHQAILMMVEMFSEMQRDQVGLIRQEVDRLHEITRELEVLQEDLARAAPAAPACTAKAVPVPAVPEPAASPNPEAGAEIPRMAAASEPLAAAAPSPDAASGATPAERPQEDEAPPAAAPSEATAPAAADEPEASAPAGAAAPFTRQRAFTVPDPSGCPVDGELHLWLYEKIATLQRERQSRLQKIISFLRGK
jgi:hypothetical protein